MNPMIDRLNALRNLPARSCTLHAWHLAWRACLLTGSTLAGAAEPPPDPTRPPEAWLSRQPPAAASGSAASPATETPPNADAGPRVTLTGQHRRIAVIDGQLVRAGDLVNGARVVAIKPQAVILQTGTERQTLRLTPAVEKRIARK